MWTKLKQQLQAKSVVLVTAPIVALVVSMMRFGGWLQPLELAAFDRLFQLRPLEVPDSRIVILEINESDLRRYNWPLSDQILAQLLAKVKTQKPAVIGLDLYRDLPVPPGSAELEELFRTTPNLIGIEKRGEGEDAVHPPLELQQRKQVGANNVFQDVDNRHRRALLFWIDENDVWQASFGFSVALMYLKTKRITLQPINNQEGHVIAFRLGRGVLPLFKSNQGAYIREYDGDPQILLNFRHPAQGFITISTTQLLEEWVDPNLMRDRIVLIGTTSISLKDFLNTPYDDPQTRRKMAGVEFQANLTSHILSTALEGRPPLYTWSEPLEYLWIVIWCMAGASLSWIVRSLHWLLPTLLAILVCLLLLAYVAFLASWWIPVVPPILGLLGSAVAVISTLATFERQERQLVMTLFGRHVTPKVAEVIYQNRYELLAEGRLRGRKMVATVLFTDLKDFSTLAERLEPDDLMAWLNEYMDVMVNQVLEHGGIVDKFIGDSVMAVFGVPIPNPSLREISENAQRAVACAVAMAQAVEQLNCQWEAQGQPLAIMRVGIATGTVITGSLGSAQRLDYTTLGDTVNVAARLESYDKSLLGGVCRILIDEETHQHIKKNFLTSFVAEAQLKGKKQLTQIYRIFVPALKSKNSGSHYHET